MIRFEWDEAKAKRNALKHGVRFEEAQKFVLDRRRTEVEDFRFDYGENRLISTARVGERHLTVVFTDSGSVIRLISARPATRTEIDDYVRNADPR
jgi:hypothetical protein